MKKKFHVGKKATSSIEIDYNKEGFTIWVKERCYFENGKSKIIKHWVIDASLLKKDGVLRMGQKELYAIEARYNSEENTITIGL